MFGRSKFFSGHRRHLRIYKKYNRNRLRQLSNVGFTPTFPLDLKIKYQINFQLHMPSCLSFITKSQRSYCLFLVFQIAVAEDAAFMFYAEEILFRTTLRCWPCSVFSLRFQCDQYSIQNFKIFKR